jgi:hypothetical protein
VVVGCRFVLPCCVLCLAMPVSRACASGWSWLSWPGICRVAGGVCICICSRCSAQGLMLELAVEFVGWLALLFTHCIECPAQGVILCVSSTWRACASGCSWLSVRYLTCCERVRGLLHWQGSRHPCVHTHLE